jgi:hypothetical protein
MLGKENPIPGPMLLKQVDDFSNNPPERVRRDLGTRSSGGVKQRDNCDARFAPDLQETRDSGLGRGMDRKDFISPQDAVSFKALISRGHIRERVRLMRNAYQREADWTGFGRNTRSHANLQRRNGTDHGRHHGPCT